METITVQEAEAEVGAARRLCEGGRGRGRGRAGAGVSGSEVAALQRVMRPAAAAGCLQMTICRRNDRTIGQQRSSQRDTPIGVSDRVFST
jgi:hypothetical protein